MNCCRARQYTLMFQVALFFVLSLLVWDTSSAITTQAGGPVRLTYGWRPGAGRVEVQNGKFWGTICVFNGATLDINTTRLICRQLGYPDVQFAFTFKSFSDDNIFGDFVIKDVQCTGNESSIEECSQNQISQSDPCLTFTHVDAAQECKARVRLSGGSSANEGWVEVYSDGEWQPACGDKFSAKELSVLCRELDYEEEISWFTQKTSSLPKELKLTTDALEVRCSGVSQTLSDCRTSTAAISKCSRVVYITCQPRSEGEVRLIGSPNEWEGHIAVYHNGTWGSVCDDGWDINDAQVVCRQLGYHDAVAFHTQSLYVQNVFNHFWYADLECVGLENFLKDCLHSGLGPTKCYPTEEAGVKCSRASNSDRDIKLESTEQISSMILQIKRADEWRSVCYRQWGTADAEVACRELGYRHVESTYGVPPSRASQYNRAWTTDVECRGNENLFYQCKHSGYSKFNCSDKALDVVGINCTNEEPAISLHLEGGRADSEGVVVVMYEGTNGTICGDGWSLANAHVVCRQLGFDAALRTSTGEEFGGTPSLMWMTYVTCNGNETEIQNCTHAGFSNTTQCSHAVGVAVVCKEVEVETANDFDVRLLGGSQSSGRIEVFYDGSWNGLCMDNLDSKTATVICRSLNYTSGIVQSESQSKKFGIGFSDVWTENITCSGSEFSLKYCSSVKWSKVACHSGSPQPGAICYNDADILSWRLVGGRSDSEGVVEVFVGNAWGTICQHKWDIMVADRVCQKIGFKMALSAVRDSHFKFPLTGTRHVLIDEIVCGDSSNNEASCTFKPSTGVCTDSEYAGVVCTNNDTEINLPIRLVGGETASEGNIQVQHDGEWGYICGTNWNINSSNVVCQMLGLSGATEALVGGFPQDEKYLCRVWLDNVQCSGNETNLWNCKHNGLGVTGCVDERQKAGVKCKGEIGDVRNDPTVGREEECNQLDLETGYTDLRLMTGNNDTTSLGRGRVEVYYKNTWGTVCDDLWDENDAQVVCKSLRFASFSRVGFPREFGTGTGHIWLDDLECVGTEGSLADCIGVKFHPNDCLHVEDASVVCNGPRISRVVEPLSTQEGNDVEIALIVSCVMIVLLGIFVLFVAVFIWRRISKKKHSQSSLTFHVDNPTSSSAIKTDIHFNANSEDVVFINESIQEDLLSKSTSNNGMQLNLYEDDNKDV